MKTVTELAQKIADQELEACCEWMVEMDLAASGDIEQLRFERRPKSLSFKEQALKELAWVDKHLKGKAPLSNHCDAIHAIRCALEQLDD